MKKKVKKAICSIALSLAIILFFEMIPMQTMKVLANAIVGIFDSIEESDNAELVSTYYDDSKNIGNATILYEDEKKRTENSKEYAMSDGTVMVRQYSTPVHYLDGNGYKEIEANSELQKVSANKRLLESVKVSSSGKVENNASELQVGKIGIEASDVFLNLDLPYVPSYYQILGARIKITYQAQGSEKQKISGANYKVFVAQETKDLSIIEQSSQVQINQDLGTFAKGEKANEYQSEIIVADLLQSDILTIGVVTDDNALENEYAILSDVIVEYWYHRVIGVKEDYSMQTLEMGGVQAKVNNGSGYVTLGMDLASVSTLSEIPFALNLVYNDFGNEAYEEAEERRTQTEIQNYKSIVGKDCKLSIQQYVYFCEEYNESMDYMDATGSITALQEYMIHNFYSIEKNLYYDYETEKIFDTVGNTMEFLNGLLKKVYLKNNPQEYILVNYYGSTSQITQMSYFSNGENPNTSVCKYTIEFEYDTSHTRILNIKTKNAGELLAECQLQYESDSNQNNDLRLVGIYKRTYENNEASSWVQTVSLEYDENGLLKDVYNQQKEGIVFERNQQLKVSKAIERAGTRTNYRQSNVAEFAYSGARTQIKYYEDNVLTSKKDVAFNVSKKVISEWQESANEIITVQTTNNFNEFDSNAQKHERKTYGFYHNKEDVTTREVSPGHSVSRVVNNTDLDLASDKGVMYGLVFCVDVEEDSYASGYKIRAYAGFKYTDFVLTNAGRMYLCVPCEYFDTNTTFKIANNGNSTIIVDYLDYVILDYQEAVYKKESGNKTHKLNTFDMKLSAGQISNCEYDSMQRLSKETFFSSASSEAKITEYVYNNNENAPYYQKEKLLSETTKKDNEDQTIVETTEYHYEMSNGVYTEKVISTFGNYKTYTETQKTTETINGDTVVKITQIDEGNVISTSYYKVMQGDMRLWKVYSQGQRNASGNVEFEQWEEYEYNRYGQITQIRVYQANETNAEYIQINHFDVNGIYLGSDYGDQKYRYTYDETGYVTGIGFLQDENTTVNNYLTYTYYNNGTTLSSNQLQQKQYANNHVENYTYTQTEDGTKTTVIHRNSIYGEMKSKYEYYYNQYGTITGHSHFTNEGLQINYDYGDLSDVNQQILTINGLKYTAKLITNQKGGKVDNTQIESFVGCHGTQIKTNYYEYDDEGRISEIEYENSTVTYGYDDNGRILNLETWDYDTLEIQKETYEYWTYLRDGQEYTTPLLAKIVDNTYRGNDKISTYENGRVSSISYNGDTYEYEYDDLGRLVKETCGNIVLGQYQYDEYNNVQIVTNGIAMAVDVSPVVYDAMGNPTLYRGRSLSWEQGRKLVGGRTSAGATFTYQYDGNGMRYKKKIGDKVTEYYYSGTRLLMENRDGQRVYYVYGQTGIEGMIYGESVSDNTFYFEKNTLGDIVAIRNQRGEVVAEYEYDAWGRVLYSYGAMAEINPFRYRGYYYDTETGFYYLQTRYYDPQAMRFINADNYELIAELSTVPGQMNLYTYCGNNPVMYTDESGELFFGWSILISVLSSAFFETLSQLISNGFDFKNLDWKQIGLSAASGLVSGSCSVIAGKVYELHKVKKYLLGQMGSLLGGVIDGSVRNLGDAVDNVLSFCVLEGLDKGVQRLIANHQATKISKLSRKAKSLTIQRLYKSANKSIKAAKGSSRNAFKNATKKEIKKIFLKNIEHTKFELVSETISSFVVGGISLCEN